MFHWLPMTIVAKEEWQAYLLGYDNYIYIEYIGRKMSFEVSVEKLFKRESISDQHD